MAERILIIGGTRNLGPELARSLLQHGYAVTVLNRGITPGELLPGVEQLRADRSSRQEFVRALGRREFAAVIDMVLFNGTDAAAVVEVLRDRVGRYLFISSGQVYLLREGLAPPFRETDYEGALIAAPDDPFDLDNWKYGISKREAEDTLARAWMEHGFPFTSLRIPMVNSERDHHHRIHGYVRRLRDGGPILTTREPARLLRHIYGGDVIAAAVALIETGAGKGGAYNLGQNESLSLDDFLVRLAELADTPPPRCVPVPRRTLLAEPFSDPWMSEMDTARAAGEAEGTAYAGRRLSAPAGGALARSG
jgi:nucleoside-diphosphate-sugar epimerase